MKKIVEILFRNADYKVMTALEKESVEMMARTFIVANIALLIAILK